MLERPQNWIKTAGILLFFIVFVLACSKHTSKDHDASPSITIFAAASLADVIEEIANSFQSKYQIEIKTNLASSGTLARQIEQGAEPDLYISANQAWIDHVVKQRFIQEDAYAIVAQNELVLVAPEATTLEVNRIDSSMDLPTLLAEERLSIGDPAHVPAGIYAQQALSYFGWYDKLQILPARDVRTALMIVELGEAPLGIVYRTDALKSKKVSMLQSFPSESHAPIVYVAGLCSKREIAKKFYQFLQSEEARLIWIRHNFKPA